MVLRQDPLIFRHGLYLFAGLVTFRVVLMLATPLVVDETYAIAVAREFSLSFYDHPPLSFWAPVAFAKITGLEEAWAYRLPTLVFGSLAAALLWRIGALIGGEKAGFWTLAAYAMSPAFVFAGVFVLPDGPLSLGSLFCGYWLIRIVQAREAPLSWWVLVGIGLAVALASKYQAALIPIGVVVFALSRAEARHWFIAPGPWLAAIIGLAGLVPLVVWNMGHGWASFTFHTGRADSGFDPVNLARMAIGQILYLLPMVAIFAVLGLGRAFKRPLRADLVMLAVLALGPVLAFNFVFAFSDESFPHWTMPGWLFSLPLVGLALAQAGRAKAWFVGLSLPFWVVIGVLIAHAGTGVLTRNTVGALPEWDNTLEAFDYSEIRHSLVSAGLLDGVELIAARNWIEGGFMSTALGGEFPVRVIGDDPHHFQFLEQHKKGGKAMLLYPALASDPPNPRVLASARAIDPNARETAVLTLKRGIRDYVSVRVFSLTLPAEK
jgi:4-amino-4-deoxy-L-arabinose transferase-like glycosyltransferase